MASAVPPPATAVAAVRWATALFALSAAVTTATAVTTWTQLTEDDGLQLFVLFFAAVQLSLSGTGAFLVTRLPRHRIPWLLLAMGVGLTFRQAAAVYAELGASRAHGPLPGDAVAAWLGDWPFVPVVAGGVLLLLHWFPSGQFLSPRWRRVGILGIVLVLVVAAGVALQPGPLSSIESVENPFGVPRRFAGVVDVVSVVSGALAFLVLAAAVAASVVRFRRSVGIEREQIKWMMFDLALVALFLAGSAVFSGALSWIALLLALASLAAMPLAAGTAILRYRLYDIDVVINRALVYGSLSALLAGTYLVVVLLMQLALNRLTAGSGLAVAASTLATAALVRPARSRIQSAVDRRFFRRKYDAARTLSGFGARLRGEIDLDALQRDLCAVVGETMQPAHVSLWTPAWRAAPRPR